MSCNNKATFCKSGHLHQSEMEADYCDELGERRERGEILEFRSQVPYDLGGCVHIVDFEVVTLAGIVEVHEVKGPEMPVWKLKLKLFKDRYPGTTYKIIKKVEKYEARYRPAREATWKKRKKAIAKKARSWRRAQGRKRKPWVIQV